MRPLSLLICTLILFSCNSYEKLLKSNDLDLKYEKAVEYYQEEDYFHAQPLFEELISVYKGSKNIEKIYYYFSYCDYGLGNYLLAAYHFRNFFQTYPKSEYAEDTQFRYAYCYYLMSPIFRLDQEYTYKAIDAFQLFINAYSESEKVKDANQFIDELRNKLEVKAFSNAKLYFNLRDYKAATLSFSNLLIDFPDTDDAEHAHFLIFKSYFLLAGKSIDSKKKERYNLAVIAYNNFLDRYPESEFMKDATNLYEETLENLKKINSK